MQTDDTLNMWHASFIDRSCFQRSVEDRLVHSPWHIQLSPSRTNVLRTNIFRLFQQRGLFVSAQISSSDSSALNLLLISKSSAVKPLWCRFSPAVHNEVNVEWSFPNFITPSKTTTQPTLFTCSFFFFFSEALRISGQLPATMWRRIGGWWLYVHIYMCTAVLVCMGMHANCVTCTVSQLTRKGTQYGGKWAV